MTWFDVDDGTVLPLAADSQAFVEGLVAATSLESDNSDGNGSAS